MSKEERGFLGIFFKSQPEPATKPQPKPENREVRTSKFVNPLKEENERLKEKIASLTRSEPVEDEDDA